MTRRRQAIAAVATIAFASRAVHGQGAFPDRTVRMIVPYPPGGSTDILARALGELLAQQLGQPVVIENRPGGATNIGTEAAVRAPADGHTVYFGTSALASNPHFGPKPSYDAFRDLVPVAPVSSMAFLVAAGPAFDASGPAAFVALARARPGKVTIGSGSLEVQVAQLTRGAGIELMHVPYKGGAQAAADAMGGHVDTVIALVPALLAFVKEGRLKPIGLLAPTRAAGLPAVPTFVEAGVPATLLTSWFGLFVPAGTPAPAIARLAAATNAAVTNPGLVSRMAAQGVDMTPGNAEDLARILRRDDAEYARLAKEIR